MRGQQGKDTQEVQQADKTRILTLVAVVQGQWDKLINPQHVQVPEVLGGISAVSHLRVLLRGGMAAEAAVDSTHLDLVLSLEQAEMVEVVQEMVLPRRRQLVVW